MLANKLLLLLFYLKILFSTWQYWYASVGGI